jgi:hypothetical protein
MGEAHTLQASRFELKYLIDELTAGGIRDFVSSHLSPDKHADPHSHAYRISSLYLDSPLLLLCGQTRRGIKNRFKLRIRFYDDDPTGPAFLEIKRRVTDVICKERAMIAREAVPRLLNGYGPDPSYLMSKNGDSKAENALLNFCNLCDNTDARGCIYVSYEREAYVSTESNSIRVTFDRELIGSPYQHGACLSMPHHGASPPIGNGERVILELKFTDRFPIWMRELVQAFNLQRTSAPKYVNCIDAMRVKPGHWHITGTGMV